MGRAVAKQTRKGIKLDFKLINKVLRSYKRADREGSK